MAGMTLSGQMTQTVITNNMHVTIVTLANHSFIDILSGCLPHRLSVCESFDACEKSRGQGTLPSGSASVREDEIRMAMATPAIHL